MTQSFSFSVEHGYSGADGISVPVTPRHGQDRVSFEADVDNGSTFCIFNRGHAETLGLSVESGELTQFKTVTGSFDAYGHISHREHPLIPKASSKASPTKKSRHT